jgi:hypothetical protein
MNEGKKDRRDPIRTIKARNPVAKNATSAIGGGAAGAHKDKKKAMKQGEVKHKKAEYAEHLTSLLRKAVTENIVAEGAVKELLMNLRVMSDEEFQTRYNMSKSEARAMLKKTNEDFNAEYDDEAGMADNNLETLKRAVDGIDDVIQTGDNLPEWCQEKIAVAKSMLVTVWDYMLSEKESFDIGMGQASHGKAGAGVAEASALEKFRKSAAEREKKHDTAEKEMKARHASGKEDMKGAIDRLEKHVNTKEGLRDPKDNPCWKGYKPVGTKKKGGKTVPNCVPKEGWTHDSLASQLFETENTYEDRLTNLLNKRLGK